MSASTMSSIWAFPPQAARPVEQFCGRENPDLGQRDALSDLLPPLLDMEFGKLFLKVFVQLVHRALDVIV